MEGSNARPIHIAVFSDESHIHNVPTSVMYIHITISTCIYTYMYL